MPVRKGCGHHRISVGANKILDLSYGVLRNTERNYKHNSCVYICMCI